MGKIKFITEGIDNSEIRLMPTLQKSLTGGMNLCLDRFGEKPVPIVQLTPDGHMQMHIIPQAVREVMGIRTTPNGHIQIEYAKEPINSTNAGLKLHPDQEG